MRCTLAYHVDAGTRARNHVYMKNDSLVWGVFNLLQGKKNYGDRLTVKVELEPLGYIIWLRALKRGLQS
jgi:hypothetical protein